MDSDIVFRASLPASVQILKDYVTLAVASVGAVLGIINTWHGLSERRVRLKVVPKTSYPVDDRGNFGPEMGCIEVTNLSAFPVTVRDMVTVLPCRKSGSDYHVGVRGKEKASTASLFRVVALDSLGPTERGAWNDSLLQANKSRRP